MDKKESLSYLEEVLRRKPKAEVMDSPDMAGYLLSSLGKSDALRSRMSVLYPFLLSRRCFYAEVQRLYDWCRKDPPNIFSYHPSNRAWRGYSLAYGMSKIGMKVGLGAVAASIFIPELLTVSAGICSAVAASYLVSEARLGRLESSPDIKDSGYRDAVADYLLECESFLQENKPLGFFAFNYGKTQEWFVRRLAGEGYGESRLCKTIMEEEEAVNGIMHLHPDISKPFWDDRKSLAMLLENRSFSKIVDGRRQVYNLGRIKDNLDIAIVLGQDLIMLLGGDIGSSYSQRDIKPNDSIDWSGSDGWLRL